VTFAQRQNHLTLHFSERIPVVKRRMAVNPTSRRKSERRSRFFSRSASHSQFQGIKSAYSKETVVCLVVIVVIPRKLAPMLLGRRKKLEPTPLLVTAPRNRRTWYSGRAVTLVFALAQQCKRTELRVYGIEVLSQFHCAPTLCSCMVAV
jgi:hypothetical protein